jgi:hypothetical protein
VGAAGARLKTEGSENPKVCGMAMVAGVNSSWNENLRDYVAAAEGRCLTEDSPQADQPPWISVPLRPHQLTLLAAAHALEKQSCLKQVPTGGEMEFVTNYGVLGDRVGAGKSLVSLALVREPVPTAGFLQIRESGGAQIFRSLAVPPVDEAVLENAALDASSGDWATGPAFLSRIMSTGGYIYTRTALFIVPHNVMPQWEEYVRNHTAGLRCQFVKRTKDMDWTRAGFYQDMLMSDAVFVSCTMLRRFMTALSSCGARSWRIIWSRVFVDEADTVALTMRTEEIPARFYWFITGSWLNMLFPAGLPTWSVTGLPIEVRAMIGEGAVRGLERRQNLVGGTVSSLRNAEFTRTLLRNRTDWIEKSLKRPRVVHREIMCRAPVSARLLRGFVSAGAMEALHAGDVAGAMSALGLKGTSKEGIVERVTASLRAEVVKAEKMLAFKREMEYSSMAAKAEGIRKAEERVAAARSQLADLEGRVAAAFGGGVTCPICYEPPVTMTLTPCCRQAFCLACLCECVKGKPACPLCRVGIASPKELLVVGDPSDGAVGESETGSAVAEPTKAEALLGLLSESAETDRFLVFSAHEESFRGLRATLEKRGIRCELLSGTAARVSRLRREFQEGKVRVLCMNARHVGAGLNLEAASHVVLFHKMNLELEKQVIGRAVRFERDAELQVVHLVHEGETGMSYLTEGWGSALSSDAGVITHV